MHALDNHTTKGQSGQRVAASAIDVNTCTMDDVIARSLVMHPSVLADALRKVACTHRQFARVCFDRTARTIASGMAEKLSGFITTLDADGSDARLPTDLGLRVMVFDAAARLNCLTPSLAEAVARREGEAALAA